MAMLVIPVTGNFGTNGGNMAVDYLGYAHSMGARNPIAESADKFGATLSDLQQQGLQREEMKRRNTLSDLQIQQGQASIDELQAKRGALQGTYGASSLQDAYMEQMQAEKAKEQTAAKQKGMETYLNTLKSLDGMKDVDPDTKAKIGKHFLSQNPEYAPIAENLTFVDSKGVKAARQFAEGELKDPVTGQPLPAGYYETEGVWTGNAANPVKLTSYKLVEKKQEYKERKYEKGDKTITEVSADGGKTWKLLSEAPRYKPVAPKVVIPKAEKDLAPGIQEKLSQKLEIYNDWSTLKDGFKPEYMPKTPFKNIGEFQINLDKVFGNNQAAVDWWTQYFDARNIILKERSGAAVMEPEFKRFEQGTIAANTNPQSVINYLNRSSKKYKQHVDSYLEANRKNHPESVKAFETAYGYGGNKQKPVQDNPGGKKPLSAY